MSSVLGSESGPFDLDAALASLDAGMSDEAVLALVARCLDGELSFDEFEEQFIGDTWETNSPLVAEINVILSGPGAGVVDDMLQELVTIRVRALESRADSPSTMSPPPPVC